MRNIELKLYITNLGKYNEGDLIYGELNLPYGEGELEEVLEEIGINAEYEEYFISDYETNLNIRIGEYTPINQLNDQIKDLECIGADVNIINGIAEHYTENLEEIFHHIHSGQVSTLHNVRNNLTLGMAIMEELDNFKMPNHLKNHFNFEEYGEQSEYHLIDGDMAFTIYW